MRTVYTKHQTPRGAKADAETADKVYLIKKVSELRLTYQIRMLAYMAQSRGKKLVIELPKEARVHDSLRDYVRDTGQVVEIERS
ncbi:MAG TPA: hypothetical protein VF522_06305 [Ramlibacter sp.]|uniref:hypothetical protein n=1 Tax=Ramlibacter sp. TaxID=1917967 RepID=UPI002ED25859